MEFNLTSDIRDKPEKGLNISNKQIIKDTQTNTANLENTPIFKQSAKNKIKKGTGNRSRSLSPASQEVLGDQLIPLHEDMKKSPEKYILTLDQIKDFMQNIQGTSDQVNITKEYTSDTGKRSGDLKTDSRIITRIKIQLLDEAKQTVKQNKKQP